MLTVLFFISVFSSLTWAVYAVLYINSLLAGNDLSSLQASDVALYVGLIIVPIWAIWQIFGLINQYVRFSHTDKKLLQLFNQMKKNQDYTDLIVRVMLDAEHEIKDGFVVNKFDVFVADINEILADIVQRCNVASSLQMEQLWQKVKNGERWAIAKTLVESAKNHNDFSSYLASKCQKDSVFKGTLLEFCYRYQNLSALLEKHDRDRIFITILETGVMGKAYSILAPVVDAIDYSFESEMQIESQTDEQTDENLKVSERILKMKEPDAELNNTSFWKKINPFKKSKQEEIIVQNNDDDDFFSALEKSMNSPEQTHQSYKNSGDEFEETEDLPRFNINMETHDTDTNFEPRLSSSYLEPQIKTEPFIELKSVQENSADVGKEHLIPVQQENETKKESDENNFAYPFGGWINEENYKK